jgi:hypothetical protein
LIAVTRDFDVNVISRRYGLRIEHECVQVKCSEYSYYISAAYLASDVRKPAYDKPVEDMDAIVGSARVTDRILVLGDFNFPKVEWGVRKKGSTLLPMYITTDLESDLIEGMLCCNMGQINSIPTVDGSFLDLIFSNASTDITVEICESPLLGLGRHHGAYELLVDVRLCKFKATSVDERRFRFRAADCEAITDELGLVEVCVDIFFIILYGLVLKNLCREPQRVVRRNFHE